MTATTPPEPIRPRHRRVQREPTPLPFALRPKVMITVALIALAVWGGFAGVEHWESRRLPLRIVTAGDGAPVEGAQIELFECATEPHMASPSGAIGVIEGAASSLVVDSGQIPAEALARVSAPGRGTTYAYLALGRKETQIELGAATKYRGRVVDRADVKPVEAAVVQLFGGGPRGVMLADALSGPDGWYEFVGISDAIEHLTLRVIAPGYSVKQTGWYPMDGPPRLPLDRVAPVSGRVVVPPGADSLQLEDCVIRVLNLPGVSCGIAPEDGRFEMNSLPSAATLCTLLVQGIGEGWTHAQTQVRAGDEGVDILLVKGQSVRGRVIDRLTERPVAGASVFHEHGPAGFEIVESDSSGNFVLGMLPPGSTQLTADVLDHVYRRRGSQPTGAVVTKQRVRQGVALIDVVAGQPVAGPVRIVVE